MIKNVLFEYTYESVIAAVQMSEVFYEDPDSEAVLESCRISESGPAQAGPDPTPAEPTTCFARPLHHDGHDSYFAHVGIRDVFMWSELVTIPFSVIRYLYRDPVLNTFSLVESAPETHSCTTP